MSVLSSNARLEYHLELGSAMPWPVLEAPEHRERRLFTAVAAFDDLCPGNAYEGRLAVQIVLCGAHAAETLREAGIFRNDFAKVKCCRAQAASLAREARAAKRILAQEQKMRLATEAVAKAAPEPEPVSAPPPSAVNQTAPPPDEASASPPIRAAAAPPSPAAVPLAAVPPLPATTQAASPPGWAGSAPRPSPEAIEKAEAFALKHPMTAAWIRYYHGVPPQNAAPFRDAAMPGDPAVIDALIHGSSELLALLDDVGGEDLPMVA